MPVTDQQVIDALRPLAGPDAPVGMVELGMVSEVRVRRHRVAVTLAHPDGPAAVGAELRRRIGDAVLALPGVRDVSVSATVMAPDRAGAYRAKVAAAAAPRPAPPGPAPRRPDQARVNPFGPRSTTRVVGITSGKGGVGKSSVTVNLAVSLARAGFRTAVLDADVYGFSVPRMLGVTGDPAVRDGKMVPPVAHGVSCMSMGFFVDDDQPVIWRGPMLHKALEQFLVDVDWAEPDFLLVDMPPGTGDVALSMAQYLPASEIYVVTTPQAAAKRVAQRSAAMARKVNLPMRGVIENMSWFTADDGTRYELFGSGGGQELADELGVALLGRVPLVPALREGGDAGRPVTVTSPDGEASRAIAGIAAAVASMGRARIFHPELTIA